MRVTATMGLLLLAVAAGSAAAQKPAGEWADGVPYLTDWDAAIKAVGETGKMLFIYNGWQREGT